MIGTEDFAEELTWIPFQAAISGTVGEGPGVYRARDAATGHVFYVGCARKRTVKQRLGDYAAGSDLNGLGAVCLTLALADVSWLRLRICEVEDGRPTTGEAWMTSALDRANIEIAVTLTATGEEASELEKRLLQNLPQEYLLNKQILRKRKSPAAKSLRIRATGPSSRP